MLKELHSAENIYKSNITNITYGHWADIMWIVVNNKAVVQQQMFI